MPGMMESWWFFMWLGALLLMGFWGCIQRHRHQRYLRAYQALVAWLPVALRAADQKALVEAAAEAIEHHLFPVHYLGILLFNPERGVLEVVAHRGKHPPSQWELSPERGIMGRVWRTGTAQRVPDVRRDADYFPAHPGTRSELDVPIPGWKGLWGVIGVESTRTHAFDARDEFFLSTLARFLGLALEHLAARRALEQRLAGYQRLLRFYEALRQQKQPEDIADLLVREVLALSQAAMGVVLLEQEGKVLAEQPPCSGESLVDAWKTFPLGSWSPSPKQPLPEALRQKGPPWSHIRLFWVESLPLSQGKVILGWQAPEKLSPWAWEVLPLLARAVDTALARQKAVRRLQRELRHLRNLRAVDRALTFPWPEIGHERKVVLRLLLRKMRRAFGFAGVALWVNSPEGQSGPCACLVFEGNVPEAVCTSHGLPCRWRNVCAAENASPMIIEDVHQQQDALPPLLSETLRRHGLRSFAAFPLRAHGQCVGQLEIYHARPWPRRQEWRDEFASYLYQAAVVLSHLSMWESLQRTNQELRSMLEGVLRAWARTLGLRSQSTRGHSERAAAWCKALGQKLGFQGEDLNALYWGAALHDIGKIGIPDAILYKPGPLTPEERRLVEQHPIWGEEIIREIPHISPIIRHAVRYHHERWDGSGYPDGLRGEEIPLEARILAVVDVWDAMTSDRPYRPAFAPQEVQRYLREQAGVLFDPQVVEAFLDLVALAGDEPGDASSPCSGEPHPAPD